MSKETSNANDTTESSRSLPDADAITAQRETEILQLRRISEIDTKTARGLIKRFGSLAGISSGAGVVYDRLKDVPGIDDELANEFHDKMREDGAYLSATEASTDDIRRGARINTYHKANGNLGESAKIIDVNQVITGLPDAALRVEFYLPESTTDTTFFVTFARNTNGYERLLADLDIPQQYWSDPPETIRLNFGTAIIGHNVPFSFEEGFIIELDGEKFRV